MGGVDLSDQLIGYHPVLRQTKRYWKTLLYHLIEVCLTNSFVLYKWQCAVSSRKLPIENCFRDSLVLSIIKKYCTNKQACYTDSYRIHHGSVAVPSAKRRRCAVCHKQTSRQCPDCPFTPALCQFNERDCHGVWHSPAHSVKRQRFFAAQKRRITPPTQVTAKRRPGRPVGSKDKKRRIRK